MKYFDVRFSSQIADANLWPVEASPLERLELPNRLHIPLAMRPEHAAVDRVFPPGTRVTRQQRLTFDPTPSDNSAEPCRDDTDSLLAIAPASGQIVGITNAMLLNGQTVPCVHFEPDAKDQSTAGDAHDPDRAGEQRALQEKLELASPAALPQWIDKFRQSAVWSDRPGSPDLLAQLQYVLGSALNSCLEGRGKSVKNRPPIDTLFCNLLDDEPTLRLNGMLAARSGPMLLAGIRLLARLVRATKTSLIVEASAPGRWWTPLRKLIRHTGIDIVPILNDYPRSDTTLLLHALLGRRLPPGRLPVERGALFLDAATAIAIGRCAVRAQPMLQVPLAIRNHIEGRSHMFVAPIGMPLRAIFDHARIPIEDAIILRGHVLHENALSADAVVSGGELTIHVLPRPRIDVSADPCIRCSWCIESCPTRIHPAGLLESSQKSDIARGRRLGLDACIECGVCTYVCPSHLPILAGIRRLKQAAAQANDS